MIRRGAEFVLLVLSTGLAAEGSQLSIKSVADLKAAIHSPRAREIVQSPKEWLPDLVASLHWTTSLSEHFVLHYHHESGEETDLLPKSLLTELERLYSELCDFLDIKAYSKHDRLALQTRLVCFIVRTDSDRTFGTLPDPHLLFYLLNPEKDPEYKVKLSHELAHWIWGRHYGEAPPLFNEGVAKAPESVRHGSNR